MKDYARLSAEAKTAYNEALLDAMDLLQTKAREADARHESFSAGCFRTAKAEIGRFRDKQINAGLLREPQIEGHGA